jgi:hypothetical protein
VTCKYAEVPLDKFFGVYITWFYIKQLTKFDIIWKISGYSSNLGDYAEIFNVMYVIHKGVGETWKLTF